MGCTVGIDGAVLALGDAKEMRPTGQIREVEVEVIGLSQKVQISGVKSEDICCVKGAQGSHLELISGVISFRSLGHTFEGRDEKNMWGNIDFRLSNTASPPPDATLGQRRGVDVKNCQKCLLFYSRANLIIEDIGQALSSTCRLSPLLCCTPG